MAKKINLSVKKVEGGHYAVAENGIPTGQVFNTKEEAKAAKQEILDALKPEQSPAPQPEA